MKTIQKIFSSLGTLNTITVYFNENEIKKVNDIMEYIEQYVYEIDNKFSIFKDTSEITGINDNAGKHPVAVSDESFEIIKLSKDYGSITEGTFDITTKPLTDLLKNKIIENEPGKFKKNSIKVNYNNIILDKKIRLYCLKTKARQ